MSSYCYYNSPIGKLMLSSDGSSLTGLWMVGQEHYAETLPKDAKENKNDAVLKLAIKWLDDYFGGKKPKIEQIALAPEGTDFRKKVWEILKQIPYGKTTTYGEIAAQIAKEKGIKKMSARAIGGAVARNPISIIIPCHRVLGAGGKLTGYSGGLDKKTKLLEVERSENF